MSLNSDTVHILVVDDSLTVRMALQDVFASQDYNVSLADGGEQCLQILRSTPIDVVILDLVMDGMTGVDVLRAMKGDSSLDYIPVLLLTAVADRKELVACLDLGAEDFVVKPWDEQELLGRVRSMIKLKKAFDDTRTSAARAEAMLNVPLQMTMLIDHHGRVQACNELAAARWRTDTSAFVGSSFRDTLRANRQDEFLAQVDSVLETGDPVRFECQWDGRTLDASIYPIAEHKAQTVECVVVALDISERNRAEEELQAVHRQLVDASRKAGRSESATHVLHNVGNTMNSVNVSANLLNKKIAKLATGDIRRVVDLLGQHSEDLGEFVTHDDKGKVVLPYLERLTCRMEEEVEEMRCEINVIRQYVEQVNSVISCQESDVEAPSVLEEVNVEQVVQCVAQEHADRLSQDEIEFRQECDANLVIETDRYSLQQVLTELLANATRAVAQNGPDEARRISIRVRRSDDQSVECQVEDSGVGIASENLTRIFAQGYSTTPDAQGYGLHGAAIMAKQLGGSLTAHSRGVGRGCCMTLRLPAISAVPTEAAGPVDEGLPGEETGIGTVLSVD